MHEHKTVAEPGEREGRKDHFDTRRQPGEGETETHYDQSEDVISTKGAEMSPRATAERSDNDSGSGERHGRGIHSFTAVQVAGYERKLRHVYQPAEEERSARRT
jgi:hypothetical protein